MAPDFKPFSLRERVSAAAYIAILLWINLYVCRELFTSQMLVMNSMHGFWMAISRWAGSGWLQSNWWPYWDGGIPFEFTYAPLVPGLTSVISAAFHVTRGIAVQSISGVAYCLAPLTLFLMAWLITRALGYSFLAALLYSLTAATQLIAPDDTFAWSKFWDARRLFLVATWDDTPHLVALVFLPLAILFLVRSIQTRRMGYYAAAAVTIAIAALASSFGPVMVAMAALCLLFVLRRELLARNILITVAIGAYAYALSARFLPPSLLHATSAAARNREAGNWSTGSITALGIVTLGWVVLWHFLPRWTSDWRLQFFTLFAYVTASVPVIALYLNRHFLPQPARYKFEAEMALALLAVFWARVWLKRTPLPVKAALLFVFLALAGEQIESYRKYAKDTLRAGDLENTIEYRASTWAGQSLPDVRILMPGSIEMWGNAFAPIQQFGGASWSMAYNPVQQRGFDAAFFASETPEKDAAASLAWLKAYGVGAVCVSGPKSPEYWKPYRHPLKFEGSLPILWREDDTTIYSIPQRTKGLAHVVTEAAVLQASPRGPDDTGGIERYVAALDDASLPDATFRWEGNNRIRIHTMARPDQAISVQVSWHPGWHASAGGRKIKLLKDGLGLMWMRPGCDGPCDIQLDYDGGWELRLCRWAGYLALAGLTFGLPAYSWRRRGTPEPAPVGSFKASQS
jgi:hypothetical protein